MSAGVVAAVPRTFPAGRVALAAGLALGLSRYPPSRTAAALQRTNHRGSAVSLASGPALALGAVVGAALPLPAAAVVGLGAAAVGGYDDAAGGGSRDPAGGGHDDAAGAQPAQAEAKGFRGHLTELRAGRVTTGTIKVIGIGTAGLVGVALLPAPELAPGPGPAVQRMWTSLVDVLLGGAVVAGTANVINLLDLRPGRALKVGLAVALGLGQPGVAATAAALLPDDLAERTMLGDAGANALGAVLGLALVDRLRSRSAVAATLAALVALTAASEVVSYSQVIDATPPLRWLDGLGRRP